MVCALYCSCHNTIGKFNQNIYEYLRVESLHLDCERHAFKIVIYVTKSEYLCCVYFSKALSKTKLMFSGRIMLNSSIVLTDEIDLVLTFTSARGRLHLEAAEEVK